MEELYSRIRYRLFKIQKCVSRMGEIPVVSLVYFPKIKRYFLGYNITKTKKMAIAHAEIIAIYRAMKKLKKEWLYGAILFSTLEPCFMCFYASILARVDKIIFFVKRDKVNITDFFSALWDEKKINHFPKIIFLYDKRFKILLQAFFRFLRKGDKIKLGKNSSDYFFV